MFKNRCSLVAILALMCAAALLASCTRPATSETLPTAEPIDGTGGGGDGIVDGPAATQTAFMEIMPNLGQTQTAQAIIGPGIQATSTPTAVILPPTNTLPPPPPTATPTPTGPRQYTVKPGDWLYKIAREQGVSYQAILAANAGINPHFLVPGQVINIPGSEPGTGGGDTGGAKTYTVKPGDNLFRIGLNNKTDYKTLAALNNIPAPYIIYPGQVLKLP